MLPRTRIGSLWLLLFANLLFAALFLFLRGNGGLGVLDHGVSNWLHANSTGFITWPMLLVTHWHNGYGLLVMGLVIAAVLWRLRDWRGLAYLVLALGLGTQVNVLLKLVFARARPQFDDPLVTLTSLSFPSGHAAGTTLLYGSVLVLLAHHPRWYRRVLPFAVAMVVLVCFSRVYLGAHYFSDVLAGVSVGLIWLTVCRLLVNPHPSGTFGR